MARKYEHRPNYMCSQHLQQWWTSSASTRNPSQSRGNNKEDRGGGAAGTGEEVTGVISKPTVGPDGCRDWAIYVGWGEASSQEAPTYYGRQSLLEGILVGCTHEKATKVHTGDSYSLQDLPVSKEHGTLYLEIVLLMDSP